MSSKEDDVRLPFSTLDPVNGDVISLLWEPETQTSMGQTINLLATEVRLFMTVPNLDTHSISTICTWTNYFSCSDEFYSVAIDVDQIILPDR
jgi:hypothetical protein